MKNLEYRFTDKSNWGDGPWQDEPDKAQFTDEKTGLPCLIVRNPFGALCGYVGVDCKHPLFGKNYDECYEENSILNVHGGLTFANKCMTSEDNHGVCHLVENGEDGNIWWLGFDCAHAYDLSPSYYARHPSLISGDDETYKDWSYIKAEISSLAAQIVQMQ